MTRDMFMLLLVSKLHTQLFFLLLLRGLRVKLDAITFSQVQHQIYATLPETNLTLFYLAV